MKRLAFLSLIVLAAGLLALVGLDRPAARPGSAAPLVVSCDDRLGPPVLVVADRYRRETRVEVQIRFGGAAELPGRLHGVGPGDLLLAADEGAVVEARRVGLIREVVSIASPAPAREGPASGSHLEHVRAAVVASSRQPSAALRFARYLAAPEKGGAVFRDHGYTASGGDSWADPPELVVYSGGVNRPAIEGLLREFAAREGVTVTTVFNGCGILCASMKAMTSAVNPKFPDAYYACDLCFVPPVARHFPEVFVLTETDFGIAVRKDNPRGIRTLADLARPGIRLGICNAEQSTLGYLTRGLLRLTGQGPAVRSNVVVEVPTADFLINQLRAGGLDAAIVYRINAAPQREHLDYLPFPQSEARAVQPFGIREDSANRQLAGRLLEAFRANRNRFEAAGFVWRGDEPPVSSAKIVIPAWLREPDPTTSTEPRTLP